MNVRNHIFISYSSKELDIALKVCEFLENNNFKCWIAPRNVEAGGNYATQIVNAIKKCDLLVLLASENTNNSGHVSNEVSIAFDNKKIIIPFKIQEFVFTDEYLYFLGRKGAGLGRDQAQNQTQQHHRRHNSGEDRHKFLLLLHSRPPLLIRCTSWG